MSFKRIGAAIAIVSFSVGPYALAQNDEGRLENGAAFTETQDRRADNVGEDSIWDDVVGLIGLAGLAGLRRRDDPNDARSGGR